MWRSIKDDFNDEYMRHVFHEKTKKGNSVGRDRVKVSVFEENLDNEIEIIKRKIESGDYVFSAYKQMLISKGAGKNPRLISIPTQRDRLVLRILSQFLSECYPDLIPELPQTKIYRIRQIIENGSHHFFAKIDVKDFYPSIDHDLVLDRLISLGFDLDLVCLIRNAITNPTLSDGYRVRSASAAKNEKGVPQGLSISNALAEIYLKSVDGKYSSFAGVEYFRYVDDIFILLRDPPDAWVRELVEDLRLLKLSTHPFDNIGSKSKVGKIQEGFDFLGYEFKNKKISPRCSSVDRFEAALIKIFTAYKHADKYCSDPLKKKIIFSKFLWRLNLKITGCIFSGRRLGWMFYFSQSTDTAPIRRIDNTVDKLCERFSIPKDARIKKLLKVFYECERKDKSDHRYIPNYDEMDISIKRKEMKGIGVDSDDLTDEQAEKKFFSIIKKETKDLEKDLEDVY